MSIEIIIPFLFANTPHLHDPDVTEIVYTDRAVSIERRGRVDRMVRARVGERNRLGAVRETPQLVWNTASDEYPIVGVGRFRSRMLRAAVEVPYAVAHNRIRETVQVQAHLTKRVRRQRLVTAHHACLFIPEEDRYDVGRDGGHDSRSRARQ